MAVLTFAAGLQLFVEPYLISTTVYQGSRELVAQPAELLLRVQSVNLGCAALSLMLLLVCMIAALVAIFRTDFFDEGRTSPRDPNRAERRAAVH